MKRCIDCGTIFASDECPECGSVNFTDTENAPSPERRKKSKLDKEAKNRQLSILITTCLLFAFCFVSLFVFDFFKTRIFGLSFSEKAELITIDMTKDQVLSIMGEPDEAYEKSGLYYFYDDAFQRRYDRYLKKIEKAGNDIQKIIDIEEKMKGKKTKLLRVTMSGQDELVSEVVFDNNHYFNDISGFSGVDFNIDEKFESVEISDGVVAISDEVNETFKFQKPNEIGRYDFTIKYSNGSFIKSSCYESKHFYLDGRPEDDTVEFDLTRSLSSVLSGFVEVKIPISVVSLSADGNLSVGEGINTFKDIYTEGFEDRITSITLPKSIRTVGEDAFVSLPKLTAVNLIDDTKYFYEKDGVIYNHIEKVVADEDDPIIEELKIIYLNNDSLPQNLKLEKGILRIGPQFDNKTGLVELTIPASVEEVDTYFLGCSSLNKINVAAGNERFFTENGILYFQAHHFSWSGDKTVFIPRDYSGEVNLKLDAALGQFEGRSQITSIKGTLVHEGTLKGCTSLKKLTINGNNKMTLGQYFGTEYYEGSVAAIQNGVTYYLPATLKDITVTGVNIEDGIFENCTTIETVSLPSRYTVYGTPAEKIIIGKGAFAGCTSLSSLVVTEAKQVFFAERNYVNNETDAVMVNSLDDAIEPLKNNTYPELYLHIMLTNG